jgi:hypothetical protein
VPWTTSVAEANLRIEAIEVGIALACLLVAELGYRLALRHSAVEEDATRSQVSTVQAATLGLVALLLAFTLSMAEARFAERRHLILRESNAIGTTYLRAGFLPSPEGAEVRAMLRRYVESRRRFYRESAVSTINEAEREGEALQHRIWALTERLARAHPDWDALMAFADPLNDMIDLDSARLAALENRVPRTILGLLVSSALLAAGVTGYGCGATRRRSGLSLVVIPLLLGLSCAVVLDLDDPDLGAIRVGERSMDRLADALGESSD